MTLQPAPSQHAPGISTTLSLNLTTTYRAGKLKAAALLFNFFLGGKFARDRPSKIGRASGRIGKRARAAPCCARCTPRAALTRRASHASAPLPSAQHHSACAGPRCRAALLVPILSQRGKAAAGRHCEGRGSAARPHPRHALPASAEAHRCACLLRAGCPFAPAARACASR